MSTFGERSPAWRGMAPSQQAENQRRPLFRKVVAALASVPRDLRRNSSMSQRATKSFKRRMPMVRSARRCTHRQARCSSAAERIGARGFAPIIVNAHGSGLQCCAGPKRNDPVNKPDGPAVAGPRGSCRGLPWDRQPYARRSVPLENASGQRAIRSSNSDDSGANGGDGGDAGRPCPSRRLDLRPHRQRRQRRPLLDRPPYLPPPRRHPLR